MLSNGSVWSARNAVPCLPWASIAMSCSVQRVPDAEFDLSDMWNMYINTHIYNTHMVEKQAIR